MKHCILCDAIKSLADFKDDDLITGYGRYCISCKNGRKSARKIPKVKNDRVPVVTTDMKCPFCNSMMVVRERRSDKHKFYGCFRFPRCRGTKPL